MITGPMRLSAMGAVFCVVIGCGDPVQNSFTRLCTDRGDPYERCACLFGHLEAEVGGDIDHEFVSFVSDFLKWTVPPGGVGLDRYGLMSKYDLSEEDYQVLTTHVGAALGRSYSQCG